MIGLDKLGVVLPVVVLIDPFDHHLAMSVFSPLAFAKTET